MQLIGFDHAVSLPDAITVRTTGDQPIQGYRFESDSVVGDYWINSNQSREDFLAEVEEKTGTLPEVVGAYVEVPREDLVQRRSAAPEPMIQTDLPEYKAPPADPATDFIATSVGPTSGQATASAARAANETWKPDFAEGLILDQGDTVSITGKYNWQMSSPYYSTPFAMADSWGMEFAFDFYTTSRALPGSEYGPNTGYRPDCGIIDDSYKDWAAASNREFNWFAMMAYDDLFITVPGYVGMYGDYNDLSDQCTRSTVAVGMAAPEELGFSNGGTFHVSIAMYPDRGMDASSRIGANVQAVERTTCETFPSIPLTDCMGANFAATYPIDDPVPGENAARIVLNHDPSDRPATYAPPACWASANYGNDAPMFWNC